MEKFNISVPKEYEKDGEKKTAWGNVGKMIKWEAKNGKPESYSIELFMFPGVKFMLFPDQPRAETTRVDAELDNIL